ncbi:MAG TPA: serine hydrolase [Caulobacteraceae bacterium]|nr:serine hydrolase [Caulobacteraceae bacterium]
MLFRALALSLALVGAAGASRAADPTGDWNGVLAGHLHADVHLRAAAGGGLSGVLDSPDQGVGDIPLTDVVVTATTLAFKGPAGSAYQGAWDPAKNAWVGAWTQGGASLPLSLTRGVAPRPSSTCPVGEPAGQAPRWCDILIWTPAQQQSAYRQMDKSFAVRAVRRGGPVRDLPRASRPLDVRFSLNGETWTTDDYIRRAHAVGILVIKDGAIWMERYGPAEDPRDRWIAFSVTKSVTSTLVGAAIKDGAISGLDALVTDYLPELRGGAYEGVTIRQLISMTSGVYWNENYGDPGADIARYDRGAPGAGGESAILAYMAKLPRAEPPGTKFNYNTGDTTLAGMIVARATHRTLADYLSEKIWSRVGMERDAEWVLAHGSADEQGGWGLNMTLRDEGRFALFFLNGGLADGKPVLPDGWVADATRNHNPGSPPGPGYGYFWWMRPGGYGAVGVYGQNIYANPEDHLVVVIQSAWPFTADVLAGEAQTAFLTAIYNATHQPQPAK